MSKRSERLSKYFSLVVQGKKRVANVADATLYLEAICDQSNPLRCIEKLVTSSDAFESLQSSFRFDVSLKFLNGLAVAFLTYIRDPGVKELCNGQFLRTVILSIVDPPLFWNALVGARDKRLLTESSEHAFAWLLWQLSASPSCPEHVTKVAKRVTQDRSLLSSPSPELRSIAYKIQNIVNTTSAPSSYLDDYRPGGRHDNDCENFRDISILPTPDEIASTETPFYRKANELYKVSPEARPAQHYDNQFRLLREDLLAELRNDLHIARGQKQGRRTADVLHDLYLEGIDCGIQKRRKCCSLTFLCKKGLPRLRQASKAERKKHLVDNRNFLKHQSFGCLLHRQEVIGFATIDRNDSLLAEDVPVLVLSFAGSDSVRRTLASSINVQAFDFVVVNTPVFAYEPILQQLQEKTDFPLSDHLLSDSPSLHCMTLNTKLAEAVGRIRATDGQNLQNLLGTSKAISLDDSQLKSLLVGLEHSLSLIQGPPGTGKSFIGALLAKILHDHTTETISVLCYTNHALDQFLEDLMDIGIPNESMVRLGSKSSDRTKPLGLFEQNSGAHSADFSWAFVNKKREELDGIEEELQHELETRNKAQITKDQLIEHLEFSDSSDFIRAFSVPSGSDGMHQVDRRGKVVNRHYLWDRWASGYDAGMYSKEVEPENKAVWEIPAVRRKELIDEWRRDILREDVERFVELYERFNRVQKEVQDYTNYGKNSAILQSKRIVACTTTAAAKYARLLQAVKPHSVLVEEAGEILESHVLTAMTSDIKRLVLIGDHKQLRPKVNNYDLTVEKGAGFDLNRSLFERLVMEGFPHTALSKQHRMCHEVSHIIRNITYPDLLDADATQKRPDLRGFQDKVVFVNHERSELDLSKVWEKRDPTSRGSKQNPFEIQMVLGLLRYLGQQGYGTDKIVVLTPYLGQLHLLRRELCTTNDPVLNDLDSYDLVRAGLVTPASAQMTRRPIRISTIDNFQGEESDIVIVTLTRSNEAGDIGFMAAPERVNVLLSRARNALIMIGNATTFLSNRNRKSCWPLLFDILRKKHHVYDGFPVKCERHPDQKAIVQNPEEFDVICPDGGCSYPCTTMLNCGIHVCPQRCHQLCDHSKIDCTKIIEDQCDKKHRYTWKCFKRAPKSCPKCDEEARAQEEKKMRDYNLELRRQQLQMQHAARLAEVENRIEEEERKLKDIADEKDRRNVLAQKVADLKNLRKVVDRVQKEQSQPTYARNVDRVSQVGSSSVSKEAHGGSSARSNNPSLPSAAADEWKRQKEFEGQSNEALESLMAMIGLEEVKQKCLDIKARVDLAVRRGTSLKDERFSATLLGNPGTGKTTVARLYAKFLSSVGVIPGSYFVETSGSRLASDGVPACKKHLEDICKMGGGALFIDEAYQLVSGNSYGGGQVLDFLLAEIENLTGKVVFVLAGYNKDMETFFAHNPGIPSRFPIEFQFRDYTDDELLSILRHRIDQKFDGRMEIEEGADGLYMRIVARRIGRGRGRAGFANARAVQNTFSRIADRQAGRLQKDRRAGLKPDDMFLNKEDLIGPDPSSVLEKNSAWAKLQDLTGLDSVKQAVRSMFDAIQSNYKRELEEKQLIQYSLNKVFLGNPGTGKTTVAKLYGQLLADLGFLSNGEVVVKNPADFVGNVLGASESTTKGILAAAMGKVLVIDEAYMLSGTSSPSGTSTSDPYKTAVIDTIVAEVQSVPGEDRCVLLLGYKDQMETMFQNVNPGLSRRFPMDSAFHFEDYSEDDLKNILDLKLQQIGFNTTPEAEKVAQDCLRRARNRPHFGNAGEVDILLDKAKLQHQQRLSSKQTRNIDVLEPQDFDPDFDRAARAATNCRKLFEGVVGCEDVILRLEGYQRTAVNAEKHGMDPREQIPFNYLFRGPPGTGKTSTARRMGKVFYDMGLLAKAEVIECSSTDLVGQYVGQTGPKTQKILEKALGKVLLIDEAYRLAEGQFGKEATDELVDCLTKPKFAQKLIVILAGYDQDINRLMSMNPGLTSRFSEAISFEQLTPEQCLRLFQTCLKSKKKLDSMAVQTPSPQFQITLLNLFRRLAALPSWGNARDIQTLARTVTGRVLATTTEDSKLMITENLMLSVINSTVSEREHRGSAHNPALAAALPVQLPPEPMVCPPTIDPVIKMTSREASAAPPPIEAAAEIAKHKDVGRDSGVTDEVWLTLQADKVNAEDREQELRRLQVQEEETQLQLKAKAAAEQEATRRLIEEENDERKRMLEKERIKRVKERQAHEELVAKALREKLARQKEMEKEKAAKKKLSEMGLCVAGYGWTRQAGGYRCAGASCFVSDAQLALG